MAGYAPSLVQGTRNQSATQNHAWVPPYPDSGNNNSACAVYPQTRVYVGGSRATNTLRHGAFTALSALHGEFDLDDHQRNAHVQAGKPRLEIGL